MVEDLTMAYLDTLTKKVNILPTGIPTPVHLSQSENGRTLSFEIVGGSGELPAGSVVTLTGTKPDGVVYSAVGTLSGNIATFEEDVQLTAAAGVWPAKIEVTNGGHMIATGRISFTIDADPVAPGSVPSESELDGLVAQAAMYAETARSAAYGSPLTAATAADMIDTTRVYVYTGNETGMENGHWYYWEDGSWKDGGIYNAAAVQTDTSLSIPGMAADAAATGRDIAAEADAREAADTALQTAIDAKADTSALTAETEAREEAITDLKADLDKVVVLNFDTIANTFINKNNGSEGTSSNYIATDYIPVYDSVWIYTYTGNDNSGYAFYDNNKKAVSYGATYPIRNTWTKLTVPENAKYFRVSCSAASASNFGIRIPVSNEVVHILGRTYDLDELSTDVNRIVDDYIGESDETESGSIAVLGTASNGFYSGGSGVFAESNDYVTYEYTLPDEQYDFSLSIYQKGDGNRDDIYYVYQALDSDGNIIASGKSKTTNQTLTVTLSKKTAKVIYTKAVADTVSYCTILWKTSVFTHINNIENSLVNDINNIAVFIGDSYVQANSLGADVDKRFSTVLCNRMGWVEKNYGVGSMGYITGDTPYISQINNAIADTSYNHAKVKYVFICGGRNDFDNHISFMDSTFVTAVQTVITTAQTAFPNAKVVLIPVLADYKYIGQTFYPIYESIIYAGQLLGALVIPDAYTWLIGMKGMVLADDIHPSIEGHALIATHIQNALATGYSFAFPSSVICDAVSANINANVDHYFTISQERGQIRVDGDFTLIDAVTANSTLFGKTDATTNNVPAYIGRHSRIAIARKTDGTSVMLDIATTYDSTLGYTITVTNKNALTAGRYIIESSCFSFGLERYASNGVWS